MLTFRIPRSPTLIQLRPGGGLQHWHRAWAPHKRGFCKPGTLWVKS